MLLKDKITSDITQAMKAKDAPLLSTLRMIRSEILKKEKEKIGTVIEDPDVITILNKMVRQHDESIEQFKLGNRMDLADKETMELEIIKKYLPAKISKEIIAEAVQSVIVKIGSSSLKDMGVIMKTTLAKLKELGGTVDGKEVSEIVKSHLK